MSSNSFNEHLRIDLRFSRFLAWFLFIIHVGALILTLLLTLPIWITLGVGLGVVINLLITLQNHVYDRHAVVHLILDRDGHWGLIYADGVKRDAELMPGSFVHLHLIVLKFRVSNIHFFLRHHSVVLTSDSVDPTTFRRLRVRLFCAGGH